LVSLVDNEPPGLHSVSNLMFKSGGALPSSVSFVYDHEILYIDAV